MHARPSTRVLNILNHAPFERTGCVQECILQPLPIVSHQALVPCSRPAPRIRRMYHAEGKECISRERWHRLHAPLASMQVTSIRVRRQCIKSDASVFDRHLGGAPL